MIIKKSREEVIENLSKLLEREIRMRVICSWCGKTVSKKKGKGTTHTICKECAKKIEKGEE